METLEKLTQTEYEFLKTYEDRLRSASNSAYIKPIPSPSVHQMREIYSRLIGKLYSMNEHCGSCVLTLCRRLYKPFKDYEDEIKRNTAGRTTKIDNNPPEISGGEIQTGDTKRTQRKVRSKSSNTE